MVRMVFGAGRPWSCSNLTYHRTGGLNGEPKKGKYEMSSPSANRAGSLTTTGVLILQNAQQLFHTHTLARTNYWAELAEILHGILLGDSTWDSRGVF